MSNGQWFASESGGQGVWALSESTSSAATISAVYGTPLSGTTATVGCTTDTSSGTLYLAVTTSATPPSAADIKAGTGAVWYGSVTVSTTSPSTTATGLAAATSYYTHAVQTVSAVDSDVASSAQWTTDNTGSGGGGFPTIVDITPAAGSATTSTLAGKSTASATITAAAGAATTSTLAGRSTAVASITPAAGAATTSALASTAGYGAIVPAAGVATTATLAGRSTAVASIVPAAGAATAATLLPAGYVPPSADVPSTGGGGPGRPSWAKPRREDRRAQAEREEEELQVLQRLQEDVLLLDMVRGLYAAGVFEPATEEA